MKKRDVTIGFFQEIMGKAYSVSLGVGTDGTGKIKNGLEWERLPMSYKED